jgi:hypothetical protein
MNAQPRKLTAADAILGETPLAMRARLRATVDSYRNEDSQDYRDALDAMLAGRPAFWTTQGYSNARAVTVLREVNAGAGVLATIRRHRRSWDDPKTVERGLDYLIPMNAPATAALLAAYSVLGAWREAEELEARQSRAA